MQASSRGQERTEKKAVVVCGPTAAGKSSVADGLAAWLSEFTGGWVPTLVVDSMQVYEEIPRTTNQARERPAEMVGLVSVEEEWTVARHKERAEVIVSGLRAGSPFVLDAGTGMYLNAILLDIPLAPKVSERHRLEAEMASEGAKDPRRASREAELRLAGHDAPRGSVWSGSPIYDAYVVYLRPQRLSLDLRIAERSGKIARDATGEGETLLSMSPNASVRQAVGPRELMLLASGQLGLEEARDKIAARTRRLARRQMRWFDKLIRTLPGTVPRAVVEADDRKLKHIMHDIMCSWA